MNILFVIPGCQLGLNLLWATKVSVSSWIGITKNYIMQNLHTFDLDARLWIRPEPGKLRLPIAGMGKLHLLVLLAVERRAAHGDLVQAAVPRQVRRFLHLRYFDQQVAFVPSATAAPDQKSISLYRIEQRHHLERVFLDWLCFLELSVGPAFHLARTKDRDRRVKNGGGITVAPVPEAIPSVSRWLCVALARCHSTEGWYCHSLSAGPSCLPMLLSTRLVSFDPTIVMRSLSAVSQKTWTRLRAFADNVSHFWARKCGYSSVLAPSDLAVEGNIQSNAQFRLVGVANDIPAEARVHNVKLSLSMADDRSCLPFLDLRLREVRGDRPSNFLFYAYI